MATDYEKAHRLSKILTTIDFPCAHGMVGQQKNPGSERLGVSFFGRIGGRAAVFGILAGAAAIPPPLGAFRGVYLGVIQKRPETGL